MKKTKILVLVVVILLIAGFGIIIYRSKTAPGQYDEFAKCLADKGAKFYGAYWCPHCKNQKKAFGKSFQYVNYIECALPDNPKAQTQECKDTGITGYPTWIFSDGTRKTGELSFKTLSEKSGCRL